MALGHFTKEHFTQGAIYLLARKREFDRKTVERLLRDRGMMKPADAHLLAGHWMKSFAAYRRHP